MRIRKIVLSQLIFCVVGLEPQHVVVCLKSATIVVEEVSFPLERSGNPELVGAEAGIQ
jgi:hypothetical protein